MKINYFLNTKYINSNFSVPNAIVDNFIRSADGNYIKVLLIILRNTSEVPSIEQLVLISGLSMENVKSALKFWEDNGIICVVDNISKTSNLKDYKPQLLQPSVIMQLSEDSKDIKDIINVAQNISGNKPLTPFEMSSLISAYNYLGMPKDVILALFSDCKLNNMNTMVFDSTISRWASMGVKTLEDANKYLHNEDYFRNVAKIFNLKYLLPNQKDLVAFWSENNYPLEIVQHVYDVLHNYDVSNAGNQNSKANIFYVNKLISNWISKGINTIDKIKQLENTTNLYDLWSAGNNNTNTNNKVSSTRRSSYKVEDFIDLIHTTERYMGEK
ncbi:MAG: DnaD domain protein [Ruminococcus sp.]|nr:DnaD domain protein [Ruminococcus sp.]MCD7800094.1 DnaD domain protein [Ruminococcus sp.]